jgi:hypothetical protein
MRIFLSQLTDWPFATVRGVVAIRRHRSEADTNDRFSELDL